MNAENNGFWKGKPVFVTGGTGFLGGWLVRQLNAAGADTVCLLRDGVPGSMLLGEGDVSRVATVFGSLEDGALLRRAFNEYSIDTVFHLAAQPLVGVAKRDPVSTFEANIKGTWNVLEEARNAEVKQIVVASSDKAYGESDRLPYTEDHPLQGLYPYDCSKSCADLISQMYFKTYDLPVSVARCANLFGGGDLNFSRTIPGAIRSTLEGEPFVIRSDGKFVRDFLYIEDAAAAYLQLAEAVANGAPQGAYNFSLEVRLTVLDCARTVLEQLGRTDLEPVILNGASAEIREQYLNCDKARRLIEWTPAHDFESGVRKAIDWYSRYLNAPRQAGAAAQALR